jgi:hypothetical protein
MDCAITWKIILRDKKQIGAHQRTGPDLIRGSTVSTGWSFLPGFETLSGEGEGVTLREIEVVGLGRFSLPRQLNVLYALMDGSLSELSRVLRTLAYGRQPCYGRLWIDVAGNPERVRRTVPLGICLTRQRLRDYIQREGINSREAFDQNTAPATTFRQQAEKWIGSLPTRRRKPIKPATVRGWRHTLGRWLLPLIGDRLPAEVGNAALKTVIEKMSVAGLAAQSIVTTPE